MQRATRERTGYHTGYTFKGQPVGARALRVVDKSLQYLTEKLEHSPPGRRFAAIAKRTMIDFHHSTTTRPATEETMLAMLVESHDAKSAEFMRLYTSLNFYGSTLLRALEKEQERTGDAEEATSRCLPKIDKPLGEEQAIVQHLSLIHI